MSPAIKTGFSLENTSFSITHSSPVNVLEEIASVTGMNYVFGPAISYGGGKYGICFMSKENPLNVRNVSLP